MKLTKAQSTELFNQHCGTGYIFIKTSFNTYHIADIQIGKTGKWYIGLDGRPLAQGLADIAKEVTDIEY